MLRKNSIAYHASFKKLFGLPKCFSNHVTCKILNCLTFEHYLNFRITKILSKLHKRYFTPHSFHILYLGNVFSDKYDVCGILDNDLDALDSRLFYIQDREPYSLFVGLPYGLCAINLFLPM